MSKQSEQVAAPESAKWWMIHFDDADIPDEYFNDGECAQKRYDQAKTNWNCTLFVTASQQATLEAEIARLRYNKPLFENEIGTLNDTVRSQQETIARLTRELNHEAVVSDTRKKERDAAESLVTQLKDTNAKLVAHIRALVDGPDLQVRAMDLRALLTLAGEQS